MNKLSFFLLSLVLPYLSCSTNEQADDQLNSDQLKVKEFEDGVLAIHDQVMPLMGKLVSLKEQIEEENKALATSLETSAADQVILNNLVISKLDAAHEGMMQWMRNFRGANLDNDPYASLKYLEEEKYKIGLVRDFVHEAIKAGEETLGTVEQ